MNPIHVQLFYVLCVPSVCLRLVVNGPVVAKINKIMTMLMTIILIITLRACAAVRTDNGRQHVCRPRVESSRARKQEIFPLFVP